MSSSVSSVSKLALLAGLALSFLTGCEATGPAKPGDIVGKYIITIGDADMTSTTFGSGELGELDTTRSDALTVVQLPLREEQTPYAQIAVSNSALCPPTCLSVTKDGRYAFVVEYRGAASATAKTIDDLPIGNTLTAIDLTDPLKPVISATAEVSKEPMAVAVHPDGDLVAVVAHQPLQQVVMLKVKDGQFVGEPTAWPLETSEGQLDAKPNSIAWHPSGKALAITLQDSGEVIFFRFKRTDEGTLALAPWGAPVHIGKSAYGGSFSPDGRFFIVSDLQWDQTGNYNVSAPEGRLVAIRLDHLPEGTHETAPEGHVGIGHTVASSVNVGINPVALAISSSGSLVVTANMVRSYLPENDPSLNNTSRGGSLSLVRLSDDGTLSNVAEYPINAMPAAVSFDAKNRFVCVTQFRSFDTGAIDGELSFFQVHPAKGDQQPSLSMADFFVGVGKGPHGVLIVR